MDSFYGVATGSGGGKNGKLNRFQFIMILSILSGIPYGLEYLISDGAITGYILLFGIILSIFFILPFTLILSELSAIIPTNHGSIGYVYRGFYSLSPIIGDFIGFINSLNMLFLYCIRLGITPIIFVQYLQNYLNINLNYWQNYLIMFGVILIGFIFGILNINFVSYTISIVVIISFIPILIGFFIEIPEMSLQNSLIGTCSDDLNLSSFIISFTSFFGFGYILIGNIMGEISFNVKKLPSTFIIIIILSQLMYFIPFITTSTVYPSCDDWEDGLFATAYGDIWKPLYYGIEISSIICNFIIYVITVILCGRLIWSMSQKYLLINKITGNIITEKVDYENIANEYKQATINNYFDDSDDDENDLLLINDINNNDDLENIENYRIPIHILPKFINKIWKKTGSPVWGILIQAIISMIICFINDNFHLWTEFLMFMYLFSFLLIILSFLILKHTENDMIREYQVFNGSKIGAWIISLLCIISIMIIGLYLVREKWEMFIIAIAMNVAFIIYYIIWRICGCFYKQTKIVFKNIKQLSTKPESKEKQNEEFEKSISATIPLL